MFMNVGFPIGNQDLLNFIVLLQVALIESRVPSFEQQPWSNLHIACPYAAGEELQHAMRSFYIEKTL